MRRPITQRGGAGFTLVEALVAVAILGLLLGVGIPRMSDWLSASRASSATVFYAEGFALARAQAVSHNSASRIVFSRNAHSGQLDWRVDICFPQPGTPCNEAGTGWSTTAAVAAGDPEGAAGFKSVLRSAEGLPGTTVLSTSVEPASSDAVYFTPLGWVAQSAGPPVRKITLAPVRAGAFPTSAVVLTLAGIASKCDPTITTNDSRRCPS